MALHHPSDESHDREPKGIDGAGAAGRQVLVAEDELLP
jgi:hypothetical protein